MKKCAIALTLLVLPLVGCALPDKRAKSPDEMAQRQLSKLPRAPERTIKSVSHPPSKLPDLPFDVYTWQPRGDRDTREIVIMGKNLSEAKSLTIGDIEVSLTPSRDGRTAAGRYPIDAPKDMPIMITVGDYQIEFPERFSPLKLEGLPQIRSCRFSWETVLAPADIPEANVDSLRAIRFDCTVDGFEARNAPVTAFFGSFAVPNSQITERENSLKGYVYRTSQLEEGVPVTIDFGHGLRVLSPVPFRFP